MSGQPLGTSNQSTPLPCGTIVYRLILRNDGLNPETNRAQRAAFLRRDNEEGLSVFLRDKCDLHEAIGSMKKVRAVVTLHVGRMYDLGLSVVPDENDPRHAEILGVPLPSDDLSTALYLGGQLAGQSRPVWQR